MKSKYENTNCSFLNQLFNNSILNSKGFTLTEVVVALAIFALFATVFVQTQGTQVNISTGFTEELKMRNLSQQVINDLVINGPELTESLFIGADEKTFENEQNYQYKIEWSKFILPDFSKLKSTEDKAESAIQLKIAEKVKENMEKLIYQLDITITNKTSGNKHNITTWIYNNNAILDLNGF